MNILDSNTEYQQELDKLASLEKEQQDIWLEKKRRNGRNYIQVDYYSSKVEIHSLSSILNFLRSHIASLYTYQIEQDSHILFYNKETDELEYDMYFSLPCILEIPKFLCDDSKRTNTIIKGIRIIPKNQP